MQKGTGKENEEDEGRKEGRQGRMEEMEGGRQIKEGRQAGRKEGRITFWSLLSTVKGDHVPGNPVFNEHETTTSDAGGLWLHHRQGKLNRGGGIRSVTTQAKPGKGNGRWEIASGA